MTWHPFGKEFNAHCRKIGQIVYDHLRPEGAWGMDVLSVGGRPLAVDLVRELDISCIFSQKLFFFYFVLIFRTAADSPTLSTASCTISSPKWGKNRKRNSPSWSAASDLTT